MLNISNVPCCSVGSVRADGVIMVDEEVFGKVSDFKTVYDNAIGDVLDK